MNNVKKKTKEVWVGNRKDGDNLGESNYLKRIKFILNAGRITSYI